MFKVLDLFAGVGGTAKGIQKFFLNTSTPFSYVAVDNNYQVLEAHKKLNSLSSTKVYDAWEWDDWNFDFIWASPPCKTHSRLNYYNKTYNPDMRLWALIKKFQKLDIPYIVENVQPYYKAPIQPTLLMGRHCFWSNKPIISCKIQNLPKKFDRMSYSDWEKYHDIKPGITEHIKEKLVRRQHLRNMVHWTISYQVIRQILFPKQKQLEVI